MSRSINPRAGSLILPGPARGDFTVRYRYGVGMKPLGVLMLLGGGALSVFSSETSNSVTVPIELRRGHVMVPVKAAGTNFSFLWIRATG
jgi:hypothetical protein